MSWFFSEITVLAELGSVPCAHCPCRSSPFQAASSGVRGSYCSLIVAVQAPGPGHLRLAIHPDLPDDALALLQPLGALQLLRGGEHVLVQSSLEAAVSPHGEIGRGVLTTVLTVAAVAAALSVLQELLLGTPPAVCVARDLYHQSNQGQHQPDAYARNKVQSCSLRIF